MSGEGLPEGWAETTVGDVLEFKYGKSLRGEDRDGGAFPVYGSSGEVGRHSEALTKGPTIIVGRKGSIGKVYFSPGPAFAIDTAYYIDVFGPFAPEYIAKWLGSAHMDEMDRASAIPGLNRNDAYDLPVSVPPLPEQKRIVARLDALQARSRAAREALAEVPALLDTFRQSVLAAAFRGDLTAEWRAKNPDVEPASKLLERIRAERKRRWEQANPKKKYVEPEPVDDSELPELPEGWVWARLEEVATDFDYGTAAKSADRGRVPVLRMGNLQGGEIDWTDLKYTDDAEEIEKYALAPSTVLFNRTNSPELVGKAAIYRGERPAVFAGYLVRVALLDGVDPDLVNLNLGSLRGRTWCWSVKSDGVSQSNISAGKLKDYVIPLCPRGEQAELVAIAREQLTVIEQMTEATRASTADLDTLDQSILARAFRGELVEQDPNDEPAEALLARIRGDASDVGTRGRSRRGSTKSQDVSAR